MDDSLDEESKLLVRAVLEREGRGFAEEIGFNRTSNPAELFGLLVMAVVVGAHGDAPATLEAARSLNDRWRTPAELVAAEPADVRTTLGGGHGPDGEDPAADLAGTLHDVAEALQRWRGDLRRLRAEAGNDPRRERAMLEDLPGVDDRAVEVVFREVQVLWPEISPFAGEAALRAARELGIGEDDEDLARYGGGPEKVGRLAGALARVARDGAYDDVRSRAGV